MCLAPIAGANSDHVHNFTDASQPSLTLIVAGSFSLLFLILLHYTHIMHISLILVHKLALNLVILNSVCLFYCEMHLKTVA